MIALQVIPYQHLLAQQKWARDPFFGILVYGLFFADSQSWTSLVRHPVGCELFLPLGEKFWLTFSQPYPTADFGLSMMLQKSSLDTLVNRKTFQYFTGWCAIDDICRQTKFHDFWWMWIVQKSMYRAKFGRKKCRFFQNIFFSFMISEFKANILAE